MKPSLQLIVVLALIGMTMFASRAQAGNPAEKLGRGIANVAFGVCEVPMKMYDVTQEQGGIAGATYGPILGVGFFLARIGVGLTDIITFPVPLPGCTDDPHEIGWGYGPMMTPAWVVDRDHNLFNIFYSDTPIMM